MNFVPPPTMLYNGEWAIPEKNHTGSIKDMEFPGVSKKWHVISRG